MTFQPDAGGRRPTRSPAALPRSPLPRARSRLRQRERSFGQPDEPAEETDTP